MKRISLLGLLVALLPLSALAQMTIDFNVSTTTGDGQVMTTITWATNPPAPGATPCTATGLAAWAGPKAGSGTEQLTLTSSGTVNIECTWPGDSIATLSWTNPTQNTDNSPYTDRKATVIRWIFNGDPRGLPQSTLAQALTPPPTGVQSVQLDPSFTMHTITGLSSVGTYSFTALACNMRDVCSNPSNLAMKTFTGVVTVTKSVGITVNPVPGDITGLAVL